MGSFEGWWVCGVGKYWVDRGVRGDGSRIGEVTKISGDGCPLLASSIG